MTRDSGTGSTRSARAVAAKHDARRIKSSARARNQQAVDNAVDDHAPACPRCDDLLDHGSAYCAECGVRVVV